MTNPKCNDCGSEMETGFLVDQRGLGSDWQRGVPEPATFVGLETSAYKIDRTQLLETTTFRCTQCGWLKSYAFEKSTTRK